MPDSRGKSMQKIYNAELSAGKPGGRPVISCSVSDHEKNRETTTEAEAGKKANAPSLGGGSAEESRHPDGQGEDVRHSHMGEASAKT